MGISEEIEVATIATDDQIAIPIKVDHASRAGTAKKSAEKCTARSEFLCCLLNLLLFGLLLSVVFAVALSSPVELPRKTNLENKSCDDFARRATKLTSAGKHPEVSLGDCSN